MHMPSKCHHAATPCVPSDTAFSHYTVSDISRLFLQLPSVSLKQFIDIFTSGTIASTKKNKKRRRSLAVFWLRGGRVAARSQDVEPQRIRNGNDRRTSVRIWPFYAISQERERERQPKKRGWGESVRGGGGAGLLGSRKNRQRRHRSRVILAAGGPRAGSTSPELRSIGDLKQFACEIKLLVGEGEDKLKYIYKNAHLETISLHNANRKSVAR